jgi:hypothetical protein
MLFITLLAASSSAVGCTAPVASEKESSTTSHLDCGLLLPNEILHRNEARVSCDGRLELVMQNDGNLVLYEVGGRPLWASRTQASDASQVILKDGNLIVSDDAGKEYYATGKDVHSGALLKLQDDGHMVIYDAASQPTWRSGTFGFTISPLGTWTRTGPTGCLPGPPPYYPPICARATQTLVIFGDGTYSSSMTPPSAAQGPIAERGSWGMGSGSVLGLTAGFDGNSITQQIVYRDFDTMTYAPFSGYIPADQAFTRTVP